jgi:DNA-binding NtrC family response regulator
MNEPHTVLYLGSEPDELPSYLPEVDSEILATVASSPDAALTHLQSAPTGCLVVDTGLQDLDLSSFLTAVEGTAPRTSVLLQTDD